MSVIITVCNMSTFNGQIEEIPGIAVDEFSEENIEDSKALFVSHCHTDHMHGLSELKDFDYPIYATSISALFIRRKFPNLEGNIKELEIGCKWLLLKNSTNSYVYL